MKHNDEIWKPISGYEGLYEISNEGRVKSLVGWNGSAYVNREKIIDGWIQQPSKKHEYKRKKVGLVKDKKVKEYFVHRLVADTFVPNSDPEKFTVVNHLDFNPLNNCAENLEWTTAKANITYSRKAFRFNKIKPSKYALIVDAYNNGMSSTEIAKKYNVVHTTILKILHEENCNIRTVSEAQDKFHINLSELLNDFKSGYSYKYLMKKYSCSYDILAQRKYRFRKEGLLSE